MRWLTILLLSSCAASPIAVAQELPNCPPREVVVKKLAEKFDEHLLFLGMAGDNGITEVFASPKGESYTILLTRPDMTSCMISAGTNWELNPVIPGEDL